MVSPKSPKAARRPGLLPRSKAGCLTCKAKHLKCDETRPACLRCSEKGLQCGGYWQGVRWSFKHQPGLAPEASPPQPLERQRLPAPHAPQPSESSANVGNPNATSFAPNIGLVDQSSAFIMNWFENVCPAWSGFDSSTNPIRSMAASMWSNSMTVSYSLESMSAAFMASRNPAMRPPALHLMKKATDCIQMELQILKNQPQLHGVHAGLLFSLFGLGTTICWIYPRGLGLPFFTEARLLLDRLNRQYPANNSNVVDADNLEFFNKCMTYCNMLLAVVHDEDGDDYVYRDSAGDITMPGYGRLTASKPEQATVKQQALSDARPHPWTGISSLTSQLFMETMRLCRRCRHYSSGGRNQLGRTDGQDIMPPFTASPYEELYAESLEEQLLDMEIPPDSGAGNTGDCSTPLSHLALVAEAYRLASLLLLYQTFPNLSFLRLSGRSLQVDNKGILWQEWITPLSLHLIKVLKRIPPTSGSRVIQPLLYISASTGLHMPTQYVQEHPSPITMPNLPRPVLPGSRSGHRHTSMSLDNGDDLSCYISHLMEDSSGSYTGTPASPVSDPHTVTSTQEVVDARQFIMDRLAILESSLPPTPVTMAKELVTAIWRAYDHSPPGSEPVHWIDVMEANDLRSMFG